MTKNLRTLALATAAVLSLGLAGCGSDADSGDQQPGGEETHISQDRKESSCDVEGGSEFLMSGSTTEALASPAPDGSSAEALKEFAGEGLQTLQSEGSWSDNEYIVGWKSSERFDEPDTLENVRLVTGDDASLFTCDVVEASSVERIDGGDAKWSTFRVTFPEVPDSPGYGMIVIDNPHEEVGDGGDAEASLELWNMTGDELEMDQFNLLQATIDQQTIGKSDE